MTSEDDPRPFVLSLVSVGTDEERYLRSLLALLKTYLEPSWCIAARLGDLPDAVLVDMDSKEGRQVWENLDFGGTPRIALSRDHVLAAEWTLLKPIRAGGAHSLTEVLTSVAGKLRLSGPAPSAPTSKWRPFAALVRKACHKSYPADVVLTTGSALVVDPHGKVFYSSRTTDELAALLRNRRRLDGKVVPVPDARKFAARLARWGIMPRPLEELLAHGFGRRCRAIPRRLGPARARPAQPVAGLRLASLPAMALEDGGDADGQRRLGRCAGQRVRSGCRRRGGFSERMRRNRNTRDPRRTRE